MPDPMSQFADWISRKQTTDSSLEPTGLGAGPSGYGQYDQLFDANPYRNLTYNQSGWQKFLSSLGFRTKYDDFVEQAQVNAAEYDAGIFSMMQQNEYNSPVEQAERMRAAGQNPDMLGTGDVASAASPVEDPNGMQVASSEDFAQAAGIVARFVGGFADLIPKAVAMVQSFQGITSSFLDNSGKVISLAEGDVMREVPAQGFKNDEEYLSWMDSLSDEERINMRMKDLHIPKHLQKRYKEAYSQAVSNLPNEVERFNKFRERADARTGYLSQRASPFYDESDEAMVAVLTPLSELNYNLQMKTLENMKYAEELKTGVLDIQGMKQDIESNEVAFLQDQNYGLQQGTIKKLQADTAKLIATTQYNITKNLSDLADRGNKLARAMQWQMTLSELYNFNPADFLSNTLDDVTDLATGLFRRFVPFFGKSSRFLGKK